MELGATQLYPRRIGQVTTLVGRVVVLGEMFDDSSLSRELCGYGPRAESPRSQWPLRRAIPLLNWRAAKKPANLRWSNELHFILTGQIEKLSQAG